MSASQDQAIRTGLGPLKGDPSYVSLATLSTTETKVTLPTRTNSGVFRVRIMNGSDTNNLAYKIVPKGTVPTFTADYAATSGTIIKAGICDYVNFDECKDLYVVGSAASTKFNITIWLQE